MSDPHLLLLGGTTESRLLADALGQAFPEWRVTTSLAGRVGAPGVVTGRMRVGGFGGASGLGRWLVEHSVTAVIDATHPFATRITANATEACADPALPRPVPLLRLERPAWREEPGDDWRHVCAVEEAAAVADRLGRRLLVTTGRREAAAFAQVNAWCLLRSIDPPGEPLPADHEVVLDRGPFTIDGERALIAERGIDVLVTKNSGGNATAAKLVAARDRGIPVVIVNRPALPEEIEVVASIPQACGWVASVIADTGYARSHGGVEHRAELPTFAVSAPSLVVGVGATSGATARDVTAHVRAVLRDNLLAVEGVAAVATLDVRATGEAIAGTATEFGVPVVAYPAHRLARVEAPVPSERTAAAVGTPSVAEAAVIAAGARLVVAKHTASHPSGASTVAVGRLRPDAPMEEQR